MMCQVCGKKTATTHIKTIVNGKLTQYHLCSDCAKEKGYSSLFSPWDLDFGNMLGGLIGSGRQGEEVQRCKKCGASFAEISKTGKLGCAECYKTFRRQLIPVIQRIHGTTKHKGKTPTSSALVITDTNKQIMPVKESPIDEKKRLLQKAIEEQNFEQAAVLRDEIKEMEHHG
jgi:protein arginine kinase activator